VHQNKNFDSDQPLGDALSLTVRFPGYVFRAKENNPNINAMFMWVQGNVIIKKSKFFFDRKNVLTKQFYEKTKKFSNGRHWWINQPFYRMLSGDGKKNLLTVQLQYLMWRHRHKYGWGWYPWHYVRTFAMMHKESNSNL